MGGEEKQKREKKDGLYPTPVLFESRLRLLSDRGRQNPCAGGEWQAWEIRGHPGFAVSGVSEEIHDTKAHTVISSEDTFQDRTIGIALSGNGSRYLSTGGSDGDSREHAANVAGAQRSARAKTARAFFHRFGVGACSIG